MSSSSGACHCEKPTKMLINSNSQQKEDEFKCKSCHRFIHACCLKTQRPNQLFGDTFFDFTCSKCSADGTEIFKRVTSDVHCLIQYDNTMALSRSKSKNWQGTVSGILSSQAPTHFTSGNSGWWRLTKLVDPPQKIPTKGRRRAQLFDTNNILEETVRRRRNKGGLKAAMERKEKEIESVLGKRRKNRPATNQNIKTEIDTPDHQSISSFGSDTYLSEKDIFNSELPDKLFKDDSDNDEQEICDVMEPSNSLSVTGAVLGSERIEQKSAKISVPDEVKSSEVISKKTERCVAMTPYDEKQLLNSLEENNGSVESLPVARRLRAKLRLRQLKRERGLPIFDIDSMIENEARKSNKPTPEKRVLDRYQTMAGRKEGHEETSFISKLIGEDRPKRVRSSRGHLLKPYIFRDEHSRPPRLALLEDIIAYGHRNDPHWKPSVKSSIDYQYFSEDCLKEVNNLLREFFWPGIDVSEALDYPEYSVVALYKKVVIGCAFIVPSVNVNESYISFIVTRPGWQKSSIGTFMLYHLIQSVSGQEVTLHVSATNTAMILYQKFGFKVDKLILDFYDRYLPIDSPQCRNAFLLRLTR
ncbi:DgyrCDS2722 [Dimorphilus gyrociliatus]|uniref:DgyrCDS2722 n=1 Tax=Dimorphilus gyrociliatus TaxID=2664684 RepID=A0A7I8VBA5_9ANNE|nr:DgyrCDS2722 [Dimorphilus gyrociliatus]